MNEKDAPKKLLPPYLPYRTLTNFLDGMRIALPQRIDRSLMKSMSGSLQGPLMLALEYLGLITLDGTPTEKLNRLVHSEGADKQRVQKEILTSSYQFLFDDGFELARATLHQLQERFAKTGAQGDTLRKCMAFFMKAAKDAGMELSPHFKKVMGPRTGSTRLRRAKVISPSLSQPQKTFYSNETASPSPSPPPEDVSLEKLLLSKFPSFDPAWSPEVQTKWFDGFEKLMAQFKKKSDD